ncbi:MAG: TIGR02757 family protein [Treponema sp.]|jgi:uncharacterized protein (TIGR02757 family)|nr:TIGR02757 family protein [Treponema sp.]
MTLPSPRKRRIIPALKRELDRWYRRVNRPEFILNDPVQFPHRYTDPADIEIAAFLAASIAWGRRELILRSAERMFALMGPSPAAFVMSGACRRLKDSCVHRTFFEKDLKYFCRGFRACYAQYGSLGALFASALSAAGTALPEKPAAAPPAGDGIWKGISLFRETMARANNGSYTKHIADPAAGSACKRINLALRWLVRREGPVDIGLWKNIPPSALYMPLDIHSARSSRRLGLLARKSNDRKAVVELTEKLRGFCPSDPVKYDLALFGMGVMFR